MNNRGAAATWIFAGLLIAAFLVLGGFAVRGVIAGKQATIDAQADSINGLQAQLAGMTIEAEPESVIVKDTLTVKQLEAELADIKRQLFDAKNSAPDTIIQKANIDSLVNVAFMAGRRSIQSTAYFDTTLYPGPDILALSMEFDYPQTALRMKVGYKDYIPPERYNRFSLMAGGGYLPQFGAAAAAALSYQRKNEGGWVMAALSTENWGIMAGYIKSFEF